MPTTPSLVDVNIKHEASPCPTLRSPNRTRGVPKIWIVVQPHPSLLHVAMSQPTDSFRHVVTFDGARALSDTDTLTLSCVGSSVECGCVDITGAIDGPGGSRLGCGAATFGGKNTSTSATFDMFDCRIQATVDVSKIIQGGETLVQGGGTLVFSGGGQHMSPSLLETDVEVHSTAEVLVPHWSARLTCKTVKVTSGGIIWFSGGLLRSPPFFPMSGLTSIHRAIVLHEIDV